MTEVCFINSALQISYFTSTFEDEQLEFAAALAERLRPEAFGPFEVRGLSKTLSR
jgi:hypothetical protein